LGDSSSTVDEKITSLKRAVAARGEENIKTFFLLTSGFEGLKNIAKKFVKNVHDLAFTYYKEKKFHIKRKQKKLIKEQIENIRYSFKHGIYSAFTKSPADYLTPVKYMREAYQQLRSSVGNSGARTSFEEKRENADLISLKLCQVLISHGNVAGFLEQFRVHFYTF
jgi:predicted negative regulator of RcsB-dependent stress response